MLAFGIPTIIMSTAGNPSGYERRNFM